MSDSSTIRSKAGRRPFGDSARPHGGPSGPNGPDARRNPPARSRAISTGLVEGGAITEVQHQQIETLYFKGLRSQLDTLLNAEETAGQISQDTHIYINALLSLSAPDVTRPQRQPTTPATATSRCWAASTRSRRTRTTAITLRRARSTTASGGTWLGRGSTRCSATALALTWRAEIDP
jgi:hypothetical protein